MKLISSELRDCGRMRVGVGGLSMSFHMYSLRAPTSVCVQLIDLLLASKNTMNNEREA